MEPPTIRSASKPERIYVERSILDAIEPEDAERYEEPNQWWKCGGQFATFSPAKFDGVWIVEITISSDDAAQISAAVKELLTGFWRQQAPGYIMTDVPACAATVSLLEAAGFKHAGALPLPGGTRVLMGWRMLQ